MATTTPPRGRTTTIDRIAHWVLDPDGDLYGDERERLRWYEGTAIAASIQWLAVPWVSAVMVWVFGRDTVEPLAAVLVVLCLSLTISAAYMQRRRVETTPMRWSPKRIITTLLHVLPYLLFTGGATYSIIDSATVIGASIGVLIGSAVVGLILHRMTVQRRRREATAAVDTE